MGDAYLLRKSKIQRKRYNNMLKSEDKSFGVIDSLSDSKDQLLYDLEMFIKQSDTFMKKPIRRNSKSMWPRFYEYAPSYHTEKYKDREVLKLINKAADLKADMRFIFNEDIINGDILSIHRWELKDLPTLAEKESVALMEKNPDDSFVYKYIGFYDAFLGIPEQKFVLWDVDIGDLNKLFRFYTLDSAYPAIVYTEKVDLENNKIDFNREAIMNAYGQGAYKTRVHYFLEKELQNKYPLSRISHANVYEKEEKKNDPEFLRKIAGK